MTDTKYQYIHIAHYSCSDSNSFFNFLPVFHYFTRVNKPSPPTQAFPVMFLLSVYVQWPTTVVCFS